MRRIVIVLSILSIITALICSLQTNQSPVMSESSIPMAPQKNKQLEFFSAPQSAITQKVGTLPTNNQNQSPEQSILPQINTPYTFWVSQVRELDGQSYQYVFGMGNPPEIALGSTELGDLRKNTTDESGFGYVTPEAEQALLRFLSNPSLGYVLNRCQNQIHIDGGGMGPIIQITYSPGYFNLDSTLYIDQDGRKKIAMERLMPIMQRLEYIAYRVDPPLWKECLSQAEYTYHLEGILRDYRFLWNAYYN